MGKLLVIRGKGQIPCAFDHRHSEESPDTPTIIKVKKDFLIIGVHKATCGPHYAGQNWGRPLLSRSGSDI